METTKGQPHPKVSVAFAPTPAFKRAYPEEVEQQQQAFATPSWADKFVPPMPPPTGSTNPLLTPTEHKEVVAEFEMDQWHAVLVLFSLAMGGVVLGWVLRGYFVQ